MECPNKKPNGFNEDEHTKPNTTTTTTTTNERKRRRRIKKHKESEWIMEKGVNHAYIKIKYKRFGFQIEKKTERQRPREK